MQATLDEGVNSINLSHLQDGTYENCNIKVRSITPGPVNHLPPGESLSYRSGAITG